MHAIISSPVQTAAARAPLSVADRAVLLREARRAYAQGESSREEFEADMARCREQRGGGMSWCWRHLAQWRARSQRLGRLPLPTNARAGTGVQ